jgi:hypothetical protein
MENPGSHSCGSAKPKKNLDRFARKRQALRAESLLPEIMFGTLYYLSSRFGRVFFESLR